MDYIAEDCKGDSFPVNGEQTPLSIVNSLLQVFSAVLTTKQMH